MHPEDLGIGRLFERIRDAVIVADAETQRIVLWNPAAEDVFGYSPSEALDGIRVEALVPERLKVNHRAGIARYAKTGHGPYVESRRPLELPAVKKGGEEIRVELSLSPLPDTPAPDGRRRFVLAIVRDVTGRKQAEVARARLAAIVEASDDAIISKTLDGSITSWNREAQRIYGYSEEEVLGKHISILVPPDRSDEVPEILEKVRRGGRVDHYETERLKKDGRRIHVSVSVSPIEDSSGKAVGASTVARDVTRRKEADEEIRRLNETLEEKVAERTAQLVESERRLKELVGKLAAAQEEERRRVAHEVHDGPTQVAVAAHQRLQAFAADHPPGSVVKEAELDRALELAQQTVKEARRLIEGLRPAALDDLGLSAAVGMLVEELRAEGWDIVYEEGLGEGERLPNEAETALYRVAQEALTNARKHARTSQACVALKRWRRDGVLLEVRDEGRGFEEARSGDVHLGEKVGLSVMRERIALLGGELKVRTEPGVGTSVVAEVPLPPDDPLGEEAGDGR